MERFGDVLASSQTVLEISTTPGKWECCVQWGGFSTSDGKSISSVVERVSQVVECIRRHRGKLVREIFRKPKLMNLKMRMFRVGFCHAAVWLRREKCRDFAFQSCDVLFCSRYFSAGAVETVGHLTIISAG